MKRIALILTAVLIVACGVAAVSSAKPPAHRLGASLDASAEAGPVVWQLSTPVQPPLGDPQVTQLTPVRLEVDPNSCNMVVVVNDGTRQRAVVGAQAGPTVCSALVAQAKAQAAAQLGVSLQ
jgi:hypothetical protein